MRIVETTRERRLEWWPDTTGEGNDSIPKRRWLDDNCARRRDDHGTRESSMDETERIDYNNLIKRMKEPSVNTRNMTTITNFCYFEEEAMRQHEKSLDTQTKRRWQRTTQEDVQEAIATTNRDQSKNSMIQWTENTRKMDICRNWQSLWTDRRWMRYDGQLVTIGYRTWSAMKWNETRRIDVEEGHGKNGERNWTQEWRIREHPRTENLCKLAGNWCDVAGINLDGVGLRKLTFWWDAQETLL